MSSQRLTCSAYETFGNCKFDADCTRSHNVWPYRTRSAVATIASEYIRVPGVIAFTIESENGTSQTQQYYVVKDPGLCADASTGDVVEILISERIHRGTGWCFAKISKILESTSKSQISSQLIPSEFREQKDCHDFLTFRDCKRSERCHYTHDMSVACDQHFHVAKILSVDSLGSNCCSVHADLKADQGGINQTESRTYFVPNKFSCNVLEGNLVILQESSRKHEYTRMNYGKIVTILHKSQGLAETEVHVERSAKYGFMLLSSANSEPIRRPPITAYSVESCSDHTDCKPIGIHISAASLGVHLKKLDQYFVPLHRANDAYRLKSFRVDSIQFALTVYVHSASRLVEGPILTPLLIKSEASNEIQKYQDYLKHMWDVLGADSFIDSMVNSLSATYVDFPKSWKELFLFRQTMRLFNEEMWRYLRSKQGRFVIVRNKSLITSIDAEDIVIPAKNLEMVESAWNSPSAALQSDEERVIALGFLLGSAKRSTANFWEEHLSDRYVSDVVSCDTLRDDQTVLTTSPIAQTVDFVNQQTVLSLMISPTEPLYSKNELIGAVTRRYPTPVILKAVVRHLTKTVANFQLLGIFGRKRGTRVVCIDEIFISLANDSGADDSEDEIVDSNPIKVILENLVCEKYCNSRLVRLSGENIGALAVATIEHGVKADKVASHVRELIATRHEYEAPYEQHEKGTLVTLGRGVELQLQVALKDLDDDGDHWLRLLRVGKDCHLCLVHINSPIWAFLSGRSDVTALISQDTLILMKEKSKSNSLKTVILKDVAVAWDDCYFYGGTFTTPTSLRRRNLLCIRKEIIGTEENSMFVWNCHAVVSDVCNNEVRFLVCSLFQDLTPGIRTEIEKGRFIVEVIDVDEGNASDQ